MMTQMDPGFVYRVGNHGQETCLSRRGNTAAASSAALSTTFAFARVLNCIASECSSVAARTREFCKTAKGQYTRLQARTEVRKFAKHRRRSANRRSNVVHDQRGT